MRWLLELRVENSSIEFTGQKSREESVRIPKEENPEELCGGSIPIISGNFPKLEKEPLDRSRWNNFLSSHRAGNSLHSP
jgi:hypothetical protein